jgi:hypothetical protein
MKQLGGVGCETGPPLCWAATVGRRIHPAAGTSVSNVERAGDRGPCTGSGVATHET